MAKPTAFSPTNIVWDIEGNGLLDEIDTIWCMSIRDVDNPQDVELFSNYDPSLRPLEDALTIINKANMWVNHNILGFDIPVMSKLGYKLKLPPIIVDTLICSQVLYPAIQNFKFPKRVDKSISWSHSLKAWGVRLGCHKGDFSDWSKYTPDMGWYCNQDTATNLATYEFLKTRAETIGVPWEFNELPAPLAIEHRFKALMMRQQATGFYFNRAACEQLAQPLLAEHEEITKELQEVFPPITETITYTTKVRKEVKTKTKTTIFNPGSRQQVGKRLVALGWEPPEFTETGLPKIDETSMAHAESVVPQAEYIARYFTLQKYLGMMLQGKNAWLRLERKGRIHGEVNTLGAITTRVTHNKPNLSQVPSVDSWLGEECRGLFSARPGWRLVGADLAGIELRCLAHYLHRWDKGEYINHVLNGDVHTVHQKAFGLPEGKEWRGIGKSGTYGLIYGAGDWKMGWTLKARGTRDEVTEAGKKFRANLMKSLPALNKLVEAVKYRRKQKGPEGTHFIRGIAGHPMFCRSEHSALNTLLQSAGAQVAKVWYILFHEYMTDLGYVYGEDYETHAFVHDEIQAGCRPEIEDVVGTILCQSAEQAGEVLGFRLPTAAEYKTGLTWSDTH